MHPRAGDAINVRDHLEGRGRAVITASSAMEYSYEGDELSGRGQPSVFTDAVVKGLASGQADRDGDTWISVDDLYDYVYEQVKERTPSQRPNKMSTLEGQVYLARSSYERPVTPAELNSELLALTKHPIASARKGAVQELAKLCNDNDRANALAARQVLDHIAKNDDSLSVRQAAEDTLRDAGDATSPTPASPRGSTEQSSRATPARARGGRRVLRRKRGEDGRGSQARRAASPPEFEERSAHAASTEISPTARPLLTARRWLSSPLHLTALSVVILAVGIPLIATNVPHGRPSDAGNTIGIILTVTGSLGVLLAAVRGLRNKLRRRRR
jgi:hypothetical protein